MITVKANYFQRTNLVGVSHRTSRILLLQEIGVTDGWESSCLMDDRSIVDLLVDTDGLVNNSRLNGLTLDNGLNSFVNVVVLVLVNVLTKMSSRPLNIPSALHVLVHCTLLVQLSLMLGEHLLLMFTRYSLCSGVDMLCRESLSILDGLNSVLRSLSATQKR